MSNQNVLRDLLLEVRRDPSQDCPACDFGKLRKPAVGNGTLAHWPSCLYARIDRALADTSPAFDLVAHLRRQQAFSERTFGPGRRTAGVLDHLRKELREIEADPADVSEWIDVVLLALDGAWRHGFTPEQIAEALEAKQTKNEARQWPDWRTAPEGKAIEHQRQTVVAADIQGERIHFAVIGPDGFVHYTRPEGEKLLDEARQTQGYSVVPMGSPEHQAAVAKALDKP